MALFSKTKTEIVKSSTDFLKNNTSLTSTSPGSTIRSIIEMNSDAIYEAYDIFDKNMLKSLIFGAEGKYLDYLGAGIAGLKRGQRSYAFASSDASVIKFYVSSGTFGDINNNTNITIPAGTKIWAIKNGIKIQFETIGSVTLLSGESEKYISARSLDYGSSSNVEANSITNHGLSYSNLKVTNISSISGGQDQESDENFRYRIANNSLAIKGGNSTSLRLAALSVPGVADVLIDYQTFGIGTTGIYVKSTTTTASSELIAQVQAAIDGVKNDGVKTIVSAPDYIPMEFDIKIKYKDTATANDRKNAVNSIIEALSSYVNNLDIGEEFDINIAASIVLSSNSNIKSIGETGKFFEKILIKYPLPNSQFTNMEVISNYAPLKFQKLIVQNNNTAFRIS